MQTTTHSRTPMILHGGNAPNRIVLEGAEEMLEYHKSVLQRKASYDLVDVKSFATAGEGAQGISALAETANASLPEGMSLEVVQSGTRQKLVLNVRPKRGFVILFK